jgi:hypothetical protein
MTDGGRLTQKYIGTVGYQAVDLISLPRSSCAPPLDVRHPHV